MPARLRPSGPFASDAIVVGDPGRAMLLAQELTEEPKMSNHARGLWGYTGARPGGGMLTVQATGIGGPSAALVLADLAELGVRRVIRVGTCVAFDPQRSPGELVVVGEARAVGGSAEAFGVPPGTEVAPDATMTAALQRELRGEARTLAVASLDHLPTPEEAPPPGIAAADMQTVAILARARSLGVAAAALLIIAAAPGRASGSDEAIDAAAKRAGRAARAIL